MDNSLTAIAGPVLLNIGNRVDLERAVANIKDSVKAYDATLATDTFLLERMVAQPRAEFIVGMKQEPRLGPVGVIGRGGTEVEELRDDVLLLLPVSKQQISKAISSLVITRKCVWMRWRNLLWLKQNNRSQHSRLNIASSWWSWM